MHVWVALCSCSPCEDPVVCLQTDTAFPTHHGAGRELGVRHQGFTAATGRDPDISFYSYESQMTSSNFKRTGKHHSPMFREGEGNSVLVSNNNVFHNFALVVKNPLANAGDTRDVGSIPGSRRSPEGGHGNRLQYSCLENPMD